MRDATPQRFESTVINCARCGGLHTLEFVAFTTPPLDATHWALCPRTQEPILMTVRPKPNPAECDSDCKYCRINNAAGDAEPLTLREDPDAQLRQRDLTLRTFCVRAASLDEGSRSVEAIFATEEPVTVMDWQRYEPIDEILRLDGAEIPDQVPMLESHMRWSIDSVFGSARQFRIDGAQGLCRLYFAAPMANVADDPIERAYQKVRGGHLRDVSAGYRALEFTDIPAGQSATVKGRTYTARQRTLRITTRWALREVSLVPIGADARSKIRAEHFGAPTVNPQLRAFLESIGLRKEASEAEAQAFYSQLNTADKARADAAAAQSPNNPAPAAGGAGTTTRSETTPPAAPATQPAQTTQRQDPSSNPPASPPATPPNPAEAARQAAEQALASERLRVRSLRELAGQDVPAELLTRAIDEGWDETRASREFLTAVRSGRQNLAGDPNYRPGIHSRSQEQDCTVRSLAMGLMIGRSNLDPIRRYTEVVDGTFRQIPNAEQNQDLQRAADNAWHYRDMSLVDVCREALRMDGQRIPTSRSEMVRAAVSTHTLSAIFTTNFSAALLASYTDGADTTVGWTSEADVPNFQSNERAQMGKFGRLKKHTRGGTAEHLGTSDSKEAYKIARYTGQFVVDEMDLIDDRFGAIEQTSPADMGLSARQLRPNLVYAILLANEALDADSVTLFHANHGNTTTGALASATLQAALTLMAKQRKNKRPLNLRARFLIVPQDLAWTAAELIKSTQLVVAGNTDLVKGNANVLANLLEIRADDRIGVAGVTDPRDDTARVGTATNYFLAARPGEEGAKTIEVGYLRGTGRMPQVRSFVQQQGQWGIGWDVSMDIGAKALDFPGLVKSTGA